MGAIIWLLLGQNINYFFVLGVLLVSSIAGVIVHIPAGIGVLEAVFMALLAGRGHVSGHDDCRAARVSRAVLFYSATAGAGVLFAAGESGEKAAG